MNKYAATELAAWIALNHPRTFAQLAKRAPVATYGPGTRLGDIAEDELSSFAPADTTDYSAGIDYSQFDIPTDSSDASVGDALFGQSQSDIEAAINYDPSLQDVLFNPNDVGSPAPIVTDARTAPVSVSQPTQSAPATPASTGNVLAAVGTSLANSVLNVGSFLTSPQGLSTLAGVATSFFNVKAQQAALATQVARAQQGLSPAPITYAMGPNGVPVPVLQGPNGAIAIDPTTGQPYNLSSQLTSSGSTLFGIPTWLLLAGGVILVLALGD